MPSGQITRTASLSVLRRLSPWAVVLLIGALLVGILPSAQAQTGANALEAIPIGIDGKLAGTTGPDSSLWYKFNYVGGGQTVTATVTFQPADSGRLDVFFYTGDANNPSRVTASQATLTDNVRTITYTDQGGARVVFIRVENDHTDRSVSFVGSLTPVATIATPTPTSASNIVTPQSTPTAGPVAPTAAAAITLVGNNGQFSGTLAANQAVWYRFYYANPGADGIVSISIAPTADQADLNIYTGTDVTDLRSSIQGGAQARVGNTISRHVQLTNRQFVYFSLGNNSSQIVAYSGNVVPFSPPPPSPTPTAGATLTVTPGPSPTAVSTPVVVAPPPIVRDGQYYQQTGFRVDDRALQFFQSRGAVDTFGYPISRLFTFIGCPVQMYQRLIIQLCTGTGPALINLLDPDIFPYTRVNGSVFPSPDDSVKARTPAVGTPEYANILQFIQMVTPDRWPDANGQPVNFWQTFQVRGGLEVLGAPISQPTVDPSNNNFVYMRFQRVILHYRAGIGTEPLLLADYLKQVMLGPTAPNLPADLMSQASGSPFYNQYCRGGTRWICRPNDLPTTDLTFAFEQG